MIGTLGEGTFCHKPSTVSAGKSEISKSIQDLMLSGPVFVQDFEHDMDLVDEIASYDFSKRFKDSGRVDDRALFSDCAPWVR